MKKLFKYILLGLAVSLMVLPLIMPLFAKLASSLIQQSETNTFLQVLSTFAFDAEAGIANLTFMFACFAGVFTAFKNKHLNISVVSDTLSEKASIVVNNIIKAISIAILVALFFATFPNIISIINPDETVWAVPVRIIFFALSLMYLGLTIIEVKRSKNIITNILGLSLGLLLALGSILGSLYGLFQLETNLLSGLFDGIVLFVKIILPLLVITFIVLAFLGMPLYIVLSGIAFFSFLQGGGYVDVLSMEAYSILSDTSMTAIPLFTIAGCLFAEGSAGKRLTAFINEAVGFLRGGPIITAVLVSTLFTTFTGASGVTILALGGVLSLILIGTGSKKDEAEALITASGAIGILLPPSLAVILYGVTNIFSGANVIDIFKGAILPGLMLALATIITGIIRDKNKNRTKFSIKRLGSTFLQSVVELSLPILVFGFYFSGLLTLVQTAAFAACYAFAIVVFIRKDYTLKDAFISIINSTPIVGGVLIIVAVAKGLAAFFIDANIPVILSDFVLAHISNKNVFLLLLNILLLIVGCIMDLYSAILVVSPLIIPIAESFGIAPVHIAVIFLTNLSLGFLTPPVGMNLFIASYTFKKPVLKIARDVLPYLIIQLIILLLVTYVPWFSMVFVN
ncbi:MAG: TRAP transporter large permease subunit [Treponemataceae bacterium]